MGLLRGLFGRSRDRSVAVDRCAECGMTEGGHTDWCTSASAPVDGPPEARDVATEEGVEDEATPS